MDAKAQTILQLYAQLERQRYELEDLRLIHRAYELAVALCTCHYRSSGRTLVEHSVGLASILANVGAEPPLVAAGVTHAVYLHGDFGTWRRSVGEEKRTRLRDAVGSAAEEIVYHYSRAERDPRQLAAIRDRLPQLGKIARDIILMRLADLLDIYGEQDALHCANVDKRREIARRWGPAIAAVAADLGFPTLAAALVHAFAEVRDATLPAVLTSPAWRDGIIVPRSYRIRLPIALYQRARSRLYALVGR